MNKSIDKCMGENCTCTIARQPVKILHAVNIDSIIINQGPSVFPGGGVRIISDIPADHRIHDVGA